MKPGHYEIKRGLNGWHCNRRMDNGYAVAVCRQVGSYGVALALAVADSSKRKLRCIITCAVPLNY